MLSVLFLYSQERRWLAASDEGTVWFRYKARMATTGRVLLRAFTYLAEAQTSKSIRGKPMTDLDAPITEVTVYSDRALVSRTGSLLLPAGVHELRILDLPMFLRDSLRTSGHGPQGARILDVDLTTTYHQRPLQAELLALQATCEQLRQSLDLLRVRQDALHDRRQWLRSLGEHTHDFARGL